LLFLLNIAGPKGSYSAQVFACNGEKLYHLAEAPSISAALEKVVQEMRLQEKNPDRSGEGEKHLYFAVSGSA